MLMLICDWCREGSVIAAIDVEFSTNVTEEFIRIISPHIIRNLMLKNNTIEIDGVPHRASVYTMFEGGVPEMNGSLISANNVSACMQSVRCSSCNSLISVLITA